MGKFSRAKKPSTEPPGLAEFAAGAEARAVEPPAPAALPSPAAQRQTAVSAVRRVPTKALPPWAGLDPDAKPTKGINLRLNDYELALLHYAAELEDRSVQKVIKRILLPALEDMAKG